MNDGLQARFLRGVVLGPDDLVPGIEQRVLDDESDPVRDRCAPDLLALFDARTDGADRRRESEN